jgi:hypothetical protein
VSAQGGAALLERDGTIVHTSEFGLGDVYCDPTGLGERCDAGHHVYVDMGLTAMLAASRISSVVVPEIGQRWAVSPFRASTPELAGWLGEHVRPFTEGLALHVERPRRRGRTGEHPAGGPVVIARHDTPPERLASLGWHHRGDREPLTVAHRRPGYPAGPNTFVPMTFNDVIDQWRIRRIRGVPRGYVGLVPQYTADALTRYVLIGKEGDELLERQRGTPTTNADVVVYDDYTSIDPTWERVLVILRLLGSDKVAQRFPNIPERTRRYLAAGRPPTPNTRALVIEQTRHDAIRAVAHAGRAIPDDVVACSPRTHESSTRTKLPSAVAVSATNDSKANRQHGVRRLPLTSQTCQCATRRRQPSWTYTKRRKH